MIQEKVLFCFLHNFLILTNLLQLQRLAVTLSKKVANFSFKNAICLSGFFSYQFIGGPPIIVPSSRIIIYVY